MKDALTYYYLSGGNVLTTNIPMPLKDAPTNWKDIEITWARSVKYKGIFTTLTDEYEFTGDGAIIMRHIFYTQGYSGKCMFRVQERIDNPDWVYDEFYLADCAMQSAKDGLNSFTVGMYEFGLATDIKSNERTPYEIPIDDTDTILTDFYGTMLRGRYNYKMVNTIPVYPQNVGLNPGNDGWYINLLTSSINQEGNLPVAIAQTGDPSFGMGRFSDEIFGGVNDAQQPYFKYLLDVKQDINDSSISGKVKIQWSTMSIPSSTTVQFYLYAISSRPDVGFSQKKILYSSSSHVTTSSDATYTELITVPDTTLWPINKDERFYLCPVIISNNHASGQYMVQVLDDDPDYNGNFALSIDFQSSPSVVKGFRYYKLLEKTIEKIADGKYSSTPGVSPYLSNPSTRVVDLYPYNLIVSCGNAIRGIANTVLKLNFEDLFQDGTSRLPLGLGVKDNVATIDHVSHFYQRNNMIADLGSLKNVIISPDEDSICTTMIFGAKFDESNKLNGKDDYNTSITYKTAATLDKPKEIDFRSPYINSMYVIEDKRINLAGKDTTDDRVDDQLLVFTIQRVRIGPNSNWFLNYPSVESGVVSGVLFPETAYNVDISPGHCRQMLSGIINSMNYPNTSPITFQSAERNAEMISKFYKSPGIYYPTVIERQDITPGTDEIYWLPFVIECESIVPINMQELMKSNPYGYFQGEYKGQIVKFFVEEASVKPANRDVFKWTGKLTPDNDLQKLIQ